MLLELALLDPAAVLERLHTNAKGLTAADAVRLLVQHSPNKMLGSHVEGLFWRHVHAVKNPLVLLLLVLAGVSAATGDLRAATVIGIMIVIGVAAERPVRDMIPADLRLIATKDLYINQASLTGKSMPVAKTAELQAQVSEPLACPALLFRGTSVQSGTATAVVVATGPRTYFGQMVGTLVTDEAPSSFQKGIDDFTLTMIWLIAIMAPLVFLINGLTTHDWREAFFFAVAVAVGRTPEMLPMIFSVCLSKGAVAMSKRKVIVKRLDAIRNTGAIEILCTDKTGTLTMDAIFLERHCDIHGVERDDVPFDFTRRMMSGVVETPGAPRRLIAKGAAEEMLTHCTTVSVDSVVTPMSAEVMPVVREQYGALSRDGFRVLAVAAGDVAVKPSYGIADEDGLSLIGFAGSVDPPKESAAVPETSVFARLTPGHKQRITRALQGQGHVVGFLGDGINDAPALHTADVGLSVETAVDIPRDAADVILLERNLLVIVVAVREGRTVFANILKYVRMGASSNFGNMFSVIGASAMLPFVPMPPIQILTNNLLNDFSQPPIPTDRVDDEQIAKPRPWSMPDLRRYILCVGPLSSIFDYTTFA